jgi:hypothetical protein
VSTPDQPPAGYASDPQLEMLWTTPPAFTGVTASGSSSSTPPLSGSFTVSLASLQSGEQAMLDATSAVVDAYNPVEAQVQSIISGDSFYGQWAEPPGYREVATPTSMPNDAISQAAQEFAAQMNPVLTRALRSVADSMQAVGIYIAMLNASGQAYTSADKNSAVPAPNDPAS